MSLRAGRYLRVLRVTNPVLAAQGFRRSAGARSPHPSPVQLPPARRLYHRTRPGIVPGSGTSVVPPPRSAGASPTVWSRRWGGRSRFPAVHHPPARLLDAQPLARRAPDGLRLRVPALARHAPAAVAPDSASGAVEAHHHGLTVGAGPAHAALLLSVEGDHSFSSPLNRRSWIISLTRSDAASARARAASSAATASRCA